MDGTLQVLHQITELIKFNLLKIDFNYTENGNNHTITLSDIEKAGARDSSHASAIASVGRARSVVNFMLKMALKYPNANR